jgi:hypothetical protein
MRRPILVENTVTVPYAPERIWRYVADTQRMDRAVGLPRARFTRVERPEGGEDVTGEYRIFDRLTVARWREHPFAWERPRHYSVVREYTRGPVVRFYGGAELEPLAPENGGGEQTRIRVFAEMTPRHPAFAPLIRQFVARRSMRRSQLQYETIAAYLAGQAKQPFVNPLSIGKARGRTTAEQIVERLLREGVQLAPARRLADWLLEMADEEVTGMRPIELARRWGTDERETIEAFLRATTSGILQMRWELICPSCRGVKAEAAHLKDLAGEGYCPACHLPFSANVDEAIEARFYPAPAVRRADAGAYCVGSPMDTPHRLAQATVRPGESTGWRLRLAPGPYTVRSPQSRGVMRIEVTASAGPSNANLTFQPTMILPDLLHLAAGDITIHLHNQTEHILTAVLDDGHWTRLALTPGLLMTMPAFRALFSVEALAAGIELSIARVGLLFSDLAGSTALYELAGEGRAFRLVGEHFEILRSAIEEAGGAVVKTIGDAVMGAFPDGEAALEAAIAIQRAIHRLDTGQFADPARLLKIGVHAGPCYAVTLNDRLDYFGATVNLAARAEHQQPGHDQQPAHGWDDGLDRASSARISSHVRSFSLRGVVSCGSRSRPVPQSIRYRRTGAAMPRRSTSKGSATRPAARTRSGALS